MSTSALLACLVASAHGLVLQPARLPVARAIAPRATAPAMLLPEALPTLDVAASLPSSLPSTVLVADLVDAISGFASSPLILLVPIGAGTLVAAAIIYVLVKSAGVCLNRKLSSYPVCVCVRARVRT